jgi:excisionase family DNA binding protein
MARPKMLTVAEAGERLGLSTATIRAWVWRRQIEYIRLGRSIRISDAVIADLIEKGTTPADHKRD